MILANKAFNTAKLDKELTKRGLTNKAELNWKWFDSGTNPKLWEEVQANLGFTLENNPTDVMVIPYLDTEGNSVTQPNGKPFVRYRLAKPDFSAKYQSPKNSGMHLYFSPTVSPEKWQEVKETRTLPLILVEGEVKAEYLNQILGQSKNPLAYAIGLAGIWGWVVGKNKLSENKGLAYFMEAISKAKSESLKKALTNLKGDERLEMCEVLEAWHEMAVFDKVTKKTNSRPIEGKVEDWLTYKESNRKSPSYLEALTWDLDDALEDLKEQGLSSSKQSAIISKVQASLEEKQEKEKEGHTVTPELQQFKLHGRTVLICFDSDINGSGIGEDGHYLKGSIAGAARHLAIALTQLEATPKMMLLPTPLRFQTQIEEKYALSDPDDVSKWGVDDYGIVYGKDSVLNLITVSLEKKELALKPYALEPLATRKSIHTYQLNLTPTEETYMCWLQSFLRNRANLAYRDNDSSYIWNGTHWEKLCSEFEEAILAEGYLQNTVGRIIRLSKTLILKYLTVPNSLWNHKADEWVLYANGSYNFFTRQFKPGFNKADYCTFAPIAAHYKDLDDFNPETFQILIQYITSYANGDKKFLQYLMAAIRWTIAPKAKYEKLPIEKFFSLVGHQGSGKSTMLSMVQKAVGLENCHKFTKDKLGTPEGLHQYCDRKMLFNSDASGSISKEAAENINMMVSGEIVETRALFKQSRQVKMQPVIWLAGNEILNFGITGTQGLSRRLITIPIERNKHLKVDGYLTEKLTSEEFQSALFYLYRQLDEKDMAAILNHTRYLPTTIKTRTVAHGKEQNPLREFWEHLDSRWSENEKQVKGFSREQLMIAFKTWAEVNNQFEYKAQKIMVHLKEIDAIRPKLNEKGVQYKYSGVPFFVLNPYQDHSTTDLRLTYDEDNGRPLIIIDPTTFLGDTSEDIDTTKEFQVILEEQPNLELTNENTVEEHTAQDIVETRNQHEQDKDNGNYSRDAANQMESTNARSVDNDSNESVKATESLHQFDSRPQTGFMDWEIDINGNSESPQVPKCSGRFELLQLDGCDIDESGDLPEA